MKKAGKVLLVAVAIAMMFSMVVSAFSDISDKDQSRAAESLKSLGIMEGVAEGVFSPNTNLTRAQFCKIAVLSMGLEDAQAFKNYTLFPDVKHTHWSAPYVNAAVRKYTIIQGFPDGTFKPDEYLTYGQAVTMLLNMLGYKVEDVGPFWPQDYVTKAKEIGLSKGISLSGNDKVTRGEAAILARNLLLTNTKDGTQFLTKNFGNVLSSVTLIATSKSDSNLKTDEAKFYIGTESTVRKIEKELPQTLIGTRGYLVQDKTGTKVTGFIPDALASKTAVLKKSYADKINTSIGEISVPRSAMVVVSGNITEYSTGWYELPSDSDINIFYGKSGVVELISAQAVAAGGNTFVYGLDNSVMLPTNAAVMKNGVKSSLSDIKKYDVVTVDYAANTITVTDKKIRGIYGSGTPSYSYPSKISLLGRDFSISESAAKHFKNLSLGKEIVLFLDYASNVIGAANGSDVSFEQMGILESLSGQKSKVRLLSGLTVEMDANVDGGGTFSTPDGPLSNYYKMLGQLVTVRENTNKKLTLGSVSYQRTDINPWNVETAKIGSKDVSPKVKVYEQVQDSAPLREIEIADIPKKQVPSSDIRYILSDSAGRVQTIVLGDVTGEGYSYGIITGGTETITEDIPPVYDPTNPSIVITPGYSISKTVTAVNLENSDGTQSYHPVTSSDVVNGPGAIAKGMKDFKYIAKMPVLALRNEGVVALDAFDGIKGVRTKSGYIELADKVEVYSPSMQKFISLGEAKANFKEFTIYTDKEYYNGGKVRVIYAK